MKMLCFAILLIGLIWGGAFLPGAYGHVEHSAEKQGAGLDPQIGGIVPTDATFLDEEGHPVTLKQLIHRPTILALVYYHCPNVCNYLLQSIAETLDKLPAEPGKDYVVLSVSFDETEKPSLASDRKRLYLKMIQRPFPGEAWRFLTGDKEDIRKLTQAVGFHFRRTGEDFEHPVSLIILSPEGKIIRYLYGAEILPFDLKMALIEASQGKVGPTIAKFVQFCFSYDPKGGKLVFNTLKVTGAVTLVFALFLITFLLFKGRRGRVGGN